jgi:TonB-dependent receptor
MPSSCEPGICLRKEDSMRRLPFLSFLLVLLIAHTCLSQSTKGTVEGRVIDAAGAVIQNANVDLAPAGLTTVSDRLGEFIFSNVAPGQYTLNVHSVGFQAASKAVSVATGQTLHVDVSLAVTRGSENVVVSAETGLNEVQAINEEMISPNIVQVMPLSQIISLPNANVADAIGRLPGVTLQRNEGEGEYVQVRGLDPRFTNLTIDGVTIPSPESAIRQVNLTTIPSDMVQSIELNKTLSANQDADGIGGSVNLVTKKAGEQPTFTIGSTLGITPIEGDRYMGKVDTTLGKRFRADKRLGLILGAEYDYNGRGINDVEPSPDLDPNNPTGTAPYYDGATFREYRYQRLRWGGTMGADYKINDHSSLGAHFLLSDFKDWGDKWYYEVQTNDKPKFYESSRKPDFAIGSLSVDGNHIFDNAWVHWGAAVSRSRELNAAGNPEVSWSTAKTLKNYDIANCNYIGTSPKSIYLPMWSAACMLPNPTPADDTFTLSNYTINEFISTTGQAVQLNLQGWASMGKNYKIGKYSSTIEFGGEVRNAHKFQNAYTPSFDYNGSATADQFEGGNTDPGYYGGNYHMGPLTSYDKLVAYYDANQSLFSLDVNDTHFSSDPANFNLIERVSAGYIMNTVTIDRLRLQTGLRIEGTSLRTLGYTINQDSSGNWLSDNTVTSNNTYWDPLPSVQARYAFTSDTNLRAVYARGISRPNPLDLIPYVSTNFGANPAITIGNPNLLPTHANDFDLLFEHQIKSLGLIEGGYFYKQLTNPIFAAYTIIPPSSPYYGTSGQAVDIQQQNVNGSGAHVSGLEIAVQERFASLPSGFSGLGINANYTYTTSNTEGVPGRTDTPTLVGQAKNSYNFEPSYEYKRYSAHMGVSYNGANIYAYQYIDNSPAGSGLNSPGPLNGPWGDNYFYPHLQVDAQVGARLYKGLHLELNGLNLTNEVFGFYNGSPQYMTQREYYKPTYSATLRWTSGRAK